MSDAWLIAILGIYLLFIVAVDVWDLVYEWLRRKLGQP